MNKSELLNVMATKAEMSKKDTEKVLKAFEDAITEELANNGKVQLVGFGTFDTTERKGRSGEMTLADGTKKPWTSEDKRAPRFKAGAKLKSACK